jgi:hypothetical protein
MTPKYITTDKWVNKMHYAHKMKYYLVMKKNRLLIHATTWMKRENITLRSQSQKLSEE